MAARKGKRTAPQKAPQKANPNRPDGFINVRVTKATRDGLHILKDVMDVRGQAEVIEKLVAIGVALQEHLRR